MHLLLSCVIVCCLQVVTVKAKNFSVVLVGGHLADDNEEIWGRIVELGGGKGRARFGVITAASEDPCCDEDSSWIYYRDLLTNYGAEEVYYVPITADHPEKNSDPAVVEHIESLTGFFFGGGDQTRLVQAYYTGVGNSTGAVASPALLAIKRALLASGGVVAGTSAGTDIQTSSVMITGGKSYDALVDGSFVNWKPVTLPNPNILTGYAPGGISFFPHGLVDTHFENRGRHGRLIRLMADTVNYPHGSQHAFGIDENTALVVEGAWNGGRAGEVIGESGVTMFDLTDAEQTSNAEGSWRLWGLRVSHLTSGDRLNLQSYVVTPATFKKPLKVSSRKMYRVCMRDTIL